MYSLIQESGPRLAVRQELPAFLVAFLAAETFYKFGSFTLELVAFLVTWTMLSYLQSRLTR